MTFPQPLPATWLRPPPDAPPSLSFREAGPADWPALRQTCYSAYAQPDFSHNLQQLRRARTAGRTVQLVVEAPGAGLIGCGRLVRYTPARFEIAGLMVVPGWRGRGVGTALIEVLTGIAQAAGCRRLEIGVTVDNRRAYALYRRLRFAPQRRIRLPAGTEAHILARDLPAV